MNFNKNILIGLGAAIFVIIVGSFIYFANKNTTPQPEQTTAPVVMASPHESQELSASLSAQNNSGQFGKVTLTEEGETVVVSLDVVASKEGVDQPAHVHSGTCQKLGEVKYPLANVSAGKSETTLDTTFEELKKLAPLAVNIHKSQPQIGVYVACADLSFEGSLPQSN